MQDCIPITIDINESASAFCVKQYDDNSRRVIMTLCDNDNPDERKVNLESHSVRLYCLLPDGQTYGSVDGAVIDPESGILEFVLTDEVTAQPGNVQAEVLVANGSQFLSLRRFNFVVLPSLADSEAVQSWRSSLA